jgi:type IV pilus assembly protein PilC
MKVFVYSAKDYKGGAYRGIIKAGNRISAVRALTGRGLLVTKLHQRGWVERAIQSFFSGVKLSEILVFTVQLAVLLDAGMPLVKALWTIIGDLRESDFKTALSFITADVEQGETLFDAMNRYPELFPPFYLHLVKAGEVGGKLPQILCSLAAYLEESQDLLQRVRGALYYPAAVILIGLIIIAFIITMILPQFKTFYTSFGADLPLPTKMFLGVADFLRAHTAVVVTLLFLIPIGLVQLARSARGIYFIDLLKLKILFFRDIFAKAAIARFSRSLALLYESGIPIVQALDIVSRTLSNKVMEQAVQRAAKNVKEGETITAPLRESRIFTNLALNLIDAGEQSGSLVLMLNKLALYYEKEVSALLKAMTSIMEPVLIFIMGLMVGVVVVVLGLPIMRLPGLIQ